MNWQVERLVAEWVKHERIIIAVDYDDTLVSWNLFGAEHELRMIRTRMLLKSCASIGARIVVFTASAPERHADIRSSLAGMGIPIEGINENLPGLPYGNHGKLYANIYLDDRAGIEEALNVLSTAYEIVRREKGAGTY